MVTMSAPVQKPMRRPYLSVMTAQPKDPMAAPAEKAATIPEGMELQCVLRALHHIDQRCSPPMADADGCLKYAMKFGCTRVLEIMPTSRPVEVNCQT